MNKLLSMVLLMPVLLFSVSSKNAYAQVNSPTIQHLYTALQTAVCMNDWNNALALIEPMIASSDITANYREELIQFRQQMDRWQATQAQFLNQPQCESVTASNQNLHAIEQQQAVPFAYSSTGSSIGPSTNPSTQLDAALSLESIRPIFTTVGQTPNSVLAQCMELGSVISQTDAQANALLSRTDLTNLDALVGMLSGLAALSEEAVSSLQTIQLADRQLQTYQQNFIAVYRGFSQATRGFVAAVNADQPSTMEQNNAQIQTLASQETALINQVNAYCGRDIIANN